MAYKGPSALSGLTNGVFSKSWGAKGSANSCDLGQLPKEATSPRMLQRMEKASPGLANTIHQRPPEDFQQSGCQLWAPGRLGNPSEAGERPNGEPAPRAPFLKKERKSRKGGGGGAHMGPQGSVANFSTWEDLEHSLMKSIAGTQEGSEVLGKSRLWTCQKYISPLAVWLSLPNGGRG